MSKNIRFFKQEARGVIGNAENLIKSIESLGGFMDKISESKTKSKEIVDDEICTKLYKEIDESLIKIRELI